MNEQKEKILDFDQFIAVEEHLKDEYKKTTHTSFYAYLEEIFDEFLKEEGNEIISKYFKDSFGYRNVPQMYIETALSGLILQCYKNSGIYTLRNDISAITNQKTMRQYINEYTKFNSPKKIIPSSRQPILLEYIIYLILESDSLEIGLFTGGEQLGDRAKRYEVVYDLSFVINFLGTFYFR